MTWPCCGRSNLALPLGTVLETQCGRNHNLQQQGKPRHVIAALTCSKMLPPCPQSFSSSMTTPGFDTKDNPSTLWPFQCRPKPIVSDDARAALRPHERPPRILQVDVRDETGCTGDRLTFLPDPSRVLTHTNLDTSSRPPWRHPGSRCGRLAICSYHKVNLVHIIETRQLQAPQSFYGFAAAT